MKTIEFGISVAPNWQEQDEIWPDGEDRIREIEAFATEVAPVVRNSVVSATT